MCAHWYFAEHFSELSCPFLSKFKGHILDELHIPFNEKYFEKGSHLLVIKSNKGKYHFAQ